MRKRLVIGATAVVVIGVVGYLLSQPRKGTLEYHKRKYVEAYQVGPVGALIHFHAPQLWGLYWGPKGTRIEFHRNALLEAGYLAQREFVVSNLQGPPLSIV